MRLDPESLHKQDMIKWVCNLNAPTTKWEVNTTKSPKAPTSLACTIASDFLKIKIGDGQYHRLFSNDLNMHTVAHMHPTQMFKHVHTHLTHMHTHRHREKRKK